MSTFSGLRNKLYLLLGPPLYMPAFLRRLDCKLIGGCGYRDKIKLLPFKLRGPMK